ncbi:MAG TPA: EamA family transporter [Terriglobales bacterium]|nr:EamA family transporter [Terriglobales bacterium]
MSNEISEIRDLLRSGTLKEIGGGHKITPAARPTTAALVAAFAAIYLIWGSTYLAIRYAIETLPPLLMMGIRHLCAGAALYGWTRWRGTPAPKLREWLHPALIGALLFLGGHGSLAWAEQHVPSGIAALLVATLPMWIVVLARIKGTKHKFGGRALAGLVLGFVGVAVLFGPDVLRHSGEVNLLGAFAVLFGTFIWAAGTIYMRSVKMPDSPVISSAMQMLAGGIALTFAATLTRETAGFHLSAVSGRSWLALAYLAVFGSIVAFTAYSWLHMVASPSRVATYAYVNPVVAVLLGWVLAAEPIGVYTVIAMVVILVGVALVNSGQRDEHEPERTNGSAEAEEAAA